MIFRNYILYIFLKYMSNYIKYLRNPGNLITYIYLSQNLLYNMKIILSYLSIQFIYIYIIQKFFLIFNII